ncbi:MAG TPA: cell division protein FtsL [Terracidiphilus sp.]|nr:cell division protein FtsL [Terracidiphilus sp.]
MAACTTTYADARDGWTARIAEHNAAIFARQPVRRRGVRTPEVHFAKQFDNSRLVKAPDPVRASQMRTFSAAITVLFSLVMIYGLQHFSAIEGGYRVEAEKQQVNHLREENRKLSLSEAELARPGRIDGLSRQMGFAAPQPGQIVQAQPRTDSSAPALAQAAAPQPFTP